MKKLAVVGAATAVVVAIMFLVGRRGCGDPETGTAKGGGAAAHGTQVVTGAASQRLDAVAPWNAQPGVQPRTIAGKVVYAGKPVEGAIVRLGLDPGLDILQQVAEAKTGADGGFDFGPRPATRFNVSAEAPGKKSAQLTVNVADPKAKPGQLVLALGDCGSRLYGSVVDASGGVIAKARLRVAGLAGGETDASGRYSVCVEPMNQWVRVEADGYGTIQVGIGLTGELRYDFVLVPEAVLVGRVVTRDRKPVTGARVLALPDPSEGPHHIASGWAISEDDGRFRIPGLSPGHYRVTATADALASDAPVDALLQPGTATRETIIVVTARARVSGHVRLGDRPIEGATVSAQLGGPGPHLLDQGVSAPAVTQPDGSFVLQGVPFGSVGFAAQPYEVTAPKLLEIKTPAVDGVTIEVAALAALHGTITRKGQPVADGFLLGPDIAAGIVRADPTGAYRVDGLKAGDVRFFAGSSELKAFATPEHVTVAAGEDKLLDIDLNFAGRVKGVVDDERGTPVPGVYVRLINDQGDIGESMSNANGEFDAGSMSGGDYQPSVYPSPMAGQPFEPVGADRLPTIKVPADGTVTGITLAVKAERFSIKGSVVDATGAPVADIHIEAIGRGKPGIDLPSIMSTADGTFAIQNLARGNYNLHAHGFDGSEGDALDIAAGSEGVVIKMIKPGAIEGTLVGFSQPPQVQMLTLTTDLFIGNNPIVEGTRFWQTGVRPGKYAIEAKVGTEVAGESIEVRSGETTRVTLTSRGIGKLEGHLYEFGTKTTPPSFRCDANLSMGGQMGGPPPDPSQTSQVDDKGHFAMAAPIGMVRVFCFAQDGAAFTVAGTDIEVTKAAVPNVLVFTVRVKASAGSTAGFRIRPLVLPLVVNQIEPKGPAETAGLQLGDTITSIDGVPVQGLLPMGASTLIANHAAGTTVTVGVMRGAAAMTFKIPVIASRD
jgi:protocatechuate 3,4-dioxygenase beta subunit